MKLAALLFMAISAQAADANLDWTDTNPAGTTYNIYRESIACTATPGGVKVNAAPVTVKLYKDANLPNGTYCWRITAVIGTVESGPSPSAGATIPSASAPVAPGRPTITVTVSVVIPSPVP